jgi:murein DD-endopeptidase MepM/ murein hydrolase activator NlpD
MTRHTVAALAATVLLLTTLTATTAGGTAPAPPPAPGSARPRFTWPLVPPHPVLRPFEPPATPYGSGHRGVDLAGGPGTPVLAAGDGTVVFAGAVAGRGVVSVDHRGGVRTTYEPVVPVVTAGQRLTAGTELGRLLPGHCAPACLHWGARRGVEYVDPLGLLGRPSAGGVRLLPWNP